MLARRMTTIIGATVGLMALTVGPALAHYCYKTGWNENAHANAQKSQAWITGDEWKGFVPRVDYEYFHVSSNVGLFERRNHSVGLSVVKRY
jgi:hypothetical protein